IRYLIVTEFRRVLFRSDDYEIFDDELTDALKALNFSNMMELEEFLTIPEEKIVCEILDDDEIITELVNNFKKKSNEEETNNLDRSEERRVEKDNRDRR